jgi:hypothetical protein
MGAPGRHLSTRGRRKPRAIVAVNAAELASALEELIAALDRRVPRVEQAGEPGIAREAAALRSKAVERLAELANNPAVLVERPPAIRGRHNRAESG